MQKIVEQPDGSFRITGEAVASDQAGFGQATVEISHHTMVEFLGVFSEKVLKTMIEQQRQALLPQQRSELN